MFFTRKQISDMKKWCIERNHCQIAVPDELKDKILNALVDFPKNPTMGEIVDYWSASIDLNLSKQEFNIIKECIFQNSAVQDASLPSWVF